MSAAATSSLTTLPPPPVVSGWACLPCDILLDIFLRVGHRDVVQSAGLVCAAWWRLARDEPALWRRIDLTMPDDDAVLSDDACHLPYWIFDGEDAAAPPTTDMRPIEMARAAVRRSAGQCEAFRGRVNDDLLLYLADRAPSLKSICITSHHDVSSKVFVATVKRHPVLEELELVLNFHDCKGIHKPIEPSTNCWAELLLSACVACRYLNRFTMRHVGSKGTTCCHHNQRVSKYSGAFAMPTSPGLLSLQLLGNSFTRGVLLRIISACPNLKSLDIRELDVDQQDQHLRIKCSRINNVSLPFPSFYVDEESDEEDIFGEPLHDGSVLLPPSHNSCRC